MNKTSDGAEYARLRRGRWVPAELLQSVHRRKGGRTLWVKRLFSVGTWGVFLVREGPAVSDVKGRWS